MSERMNITMKIGNNSLTASGTTEDVWKAIEVFRLLAYTPLTLTASPFTTGLGQGSASAQVGGF